MTLWMTYIGGRATACGAPAAPHHDAPAAAAYTAGLHLVTVVPLPMGMTGHCCCGLPTNDGATTPAPAVQPRHPLPLIPPGPKP